MAQRSVTINPNPKDAYLYCYRDCADIRRALRLGHIINNSLDVIKICEKGPKIIDDKDRAYIAHQMGQIFVCDHVVASLAERMILTYEESKLVKTTMGTTYYNPAKAERFLRVDAAEELHRSGEKGIKIFNGVKAELNALHTLNRNSGIRDSMFSSPLRVLCSAYNNSADFLGIAEKEWDTINFLDMLGPTRNI